jgi:hypothetical protein
MRGWLVLGAAVMAACMPPPMNVGYVAMNPSGRGGVDVQGQVGAGGVVPDGGAGGGGSAQVEPFVAPRVSIPVGVGVVGMRDAGFAPLRVGVRHRPTSFLAYGAGIGPSVMFDRGSIVAAGVADVELVLGLQRPRVGFSVGLRPAVSFDAGLATIYAMCDPTLAVRIAAGTSITFAVPFGLIHTVGVGIGTFAFMSGALGVHRRF